MVDIFSKEQFEEALPKHKETTKPLWEGLGLVDGEYSYTVPVTPYASIMIRSSVDREGYAASSGQDSIRLWIVDPKTSAPMGGKLDAYTKRTTNWRTKMTEKLRTLYFIAKFVRPCACGGNVFVAKSKKNNELKGFIFAACDKRDATGKPCCTVTKFRWIADNKGNKIEPTPADTAGATAAKRIIANVRMNSTR